MLRGGAPPGRPRSAPAPCAAATAVDRGAHAGPAAAGAGRPSRRSGEPRAAAASAVPAVRRQRPDDRRPPGRRHRRPAQRQPRCSASPAEPPWPPCPLGRLDRADRGLRDRLGLPVQLVVLRAQSVDPVELGRPLVAVGEVDERRPDPVGQLHHPVGHVEIAPGDLRPVQRRVDQLVDGAAPLGRHLDEIGDVDAAADLGDLRPPVGEQPVVTDESPRQPAGVLLRAQHAVDPGHRPAGVGLPGPVRPLRAVQDLGGRPEHRHGGDGQPELRGGLLPQRQEPGEARVLDDDPVDADELDPEPGLQLLPDGPVGCEPGSGLPRLRSRVEHPEVGLPHQPPVELHDPARLAEPAGVGVVGRHLRLRRVVAEPGQDPGAQAGAATAHADHEDQVAPGSIGRGSHAHLCRGVVEVGVVTNGANSCWTTRSAACPSSSVQNLARKAARWVAAACDETAPVRNPSTSSGSRPGDEAGRLREQVEVRPAALDVGLPVRCVDDDRPVEEGIVEHHRRVVGEQDVGREAELLDRGVAAHVPQQPLVGEPAEPGRSRGEVVHPDQDHVVGVRSAQSLGEGGQVERHDEGPVVLPVGGRVQHHRLAGRRRQGSAARPAPTRRSRRPAGRCAGSRPRGWCSCRGTRAPTPAC